MEQFNRVEMKYVIPIRKYIHFKKFIENNLIRDELSKSGFYDVFSVYFDTPRFQYYKDKIDGFENRQKFRIRFYDHPTDITQNQFIGLEIKEKLNNTINKTRVQITQAQASELLNRRRDDYHDFLDGKFLDIFDQHVLPKVQTNYKREAFFQKNNRNLRITFDYLNHAWMIDPIKRTPLKINKYLLSNELGILEIKGYSGIPYWLQKSIREFRLSHEKVSKYCLGIDAWKDSIEKNTAVYYG